VKNSFLTQYTSQLLDYMYEQHTKLKNSQALRKGNAISDASVQQTEMCPSNGIRSIPALWNT